MLHDRQRRHEGDDTIHVRAFQIVTGHQDQKVPMARRSRLLVITACAEEWEQGTAMSAKEEVTDIGFTAVRTGSSVTRDSL